MKDYNPKTSWLEYFFLAGFCIFIFLMIVNIVLSLFELTL